MRGVPGELLKTHPIRSPIWDQCPDGPNRECDGLRVQKEELDKGPLSQRETEVRDTRSELSGHVVRTRREHGDNQRRQETPGDVQSTTTIEATH